MAKKPIICSLDIENLKQITRSIAGSILGPRKRGLIHFRHIEHVNYALKLETNNQIEIKTEIPQHIFTQLTIPVPAEEQQEQVISIPKPESDAIPVEPVVTAPAEPELPATPEFTTSNEKPEWYLTWEQVEGMSKKDILEHFESVEEITIPKSKNAEQTKELTHQALAELFADHVAE